MKRDPVYVLGKECKFVKLSYGERLWSSDAPCLIRVVHSAAGDYWSVGILSSQQRMLVFALQPTLAEAVESAEREWAVLASDVAGLESIRTRDHALRFLNETGSCGTCCRDGTSTSGTRQTKT